MKNRKVYIVSDGTGLTAQSLGQSLLTQFENIQFEITTLPFIDTCEKAQNVIREISSDTTEKPIVFSTLVNRDIRALLNQGPFLCMDLFDTFISPLEKELGSSSSHTIGKAHGINVNNYQDYMLRINAVNYVLANDDGANLKDLNRADIILLGVSRCGKTPTCLYLALQFGLYAANYPMTEDEKSLRELPEVLLPFKQKIFGLTIDAQQLSKIRNERRPHSQYSNLRQCQYEIKEVEALFDKAHIKYISSANRSIEELATQIVSECKLKRRLF